jgi:hypothetical protein
MTFTKSIPEKNQANTILNPEKKWKSFDLLSIQTQADPFSVRCYREFQTISDAALSKLFERTAIDRTG